MLGTQNGKVSTLHQEVETLSKSFSSLPLEPTVPEVCTLPSSQGDLIR